MLGCVGGSPSGPLLQMDAACWEHVCVRLCGGVFFLSKRSKDKRGVGGQVLSFVCYGVYICIGSVQVVSSLDG